MLEAHDVLEDVEHARHLREDEDLVVRLLLLRGDELAEALHLARLKEGAVGERAGAEDAHLLAAERVQLVVGPRLQHADELRVRDAHKALVVRLRGAVREEHLRHLRNTLVRVQRAHQQRVVCRLAKLHDDVVHQG